MRPSSLGPTGTGDEMTGHRSFTELVRGHAADQPGRDALVVVDDAGQARRIRYAQLDSESRTLAAWLHIHGALGNGC